MTTFPVIASTLSPEALVSDILPGFGIGSAVECKFYSGGFNHTYRVKTVDGSTYYLRAYRIRWRTLADIQYELDVLNHLNRKGFPAARPIPYQDGQSLLCYPCPGGDTLPGAFHRSTWTRDIL